jgi:endo-1,4-beta-xylanase
MNKLLKIQAIAAIVTIAMVQCTPKTINQRSLKDAFANKFLIGVALNTQQINGNDSIAIPLTLKHFNSIVAENCMKAENTQPKQGVFTFDDGDKFVNFGIENNLNVIGHCLIWHSQAPRWFFTDSLGNDVSRDTLIERMRTHIDTVVKHFKGRVHGWDVVNEALTDEGGWRQSKFYTIIGPEYVELAFKFAYQADSTVELYYNEYNNEKPAKREATIQLVKNLQAKGIRIDAVGIQGHYTMDFPEFTDLDASIKAFAALGVQVMITELDLTVIPWPSENVTADISFSVQAQEKYNPYANGIPDSMQQIIDQRWLSIFEVLNNNAHAVSRVTLWGLHDNQTWRNNWPIKGRKDYPVLFDRQYQPKPVVSKIIEIGLNN